MSLLKIRPMEPQDHDGVFALWRGDPAMGLNSMDSTKDGTWGYFEQYPDACFVAEKLNKIVGAVLCRHEQGKAQFHHLSVCVEERSEDIEKDLIAVALAALKRKGIKRVSVMHFGDGPYPESFWTKHGFTKKDFITFRGRVVKRLTWVDPDL